VGKRSPHALRRSYFGKGRWNER